MKTFLIGFGWVAGFLTVSLGYLHFTDYVKRSTGTDIVGWAPLIISFIGLCYCVGCIVQTWNGKTK